MKNSISTYDGLIDIEEFVNLLDNIINYDLINNNNNNKNLLENQDKINDDEINDRIMNLILNFNRKFIQKLLFLCIMIYHCHLFHHL